MAAILFSMRGRVGRDTYWITVVPLFLTGVLGWLLSSVDHTQAALVGNAVGLSVVWPLLAVNVKRWHDRDKSGWWLLVGALPVVGQVWWLVECGFLPGTDGFNGYGEQPPRFLPAKASAAKAAAARKSMTPVEAADAAAERVPADLASFMKMAGLMIRAESDPEFLPKKYDVLREHLKSEEGLESRMLDDALMIARGARFSRDSFDAHAEIVKEAHKTSQKEVEETADPEQATSAAASRNGTSNGSPKAEDPDATQTESDTDSEYSEKYEAQFDWKPSDTAAPTADYDTVTLNTISDLIFKLAMVDEKLSDCEEILLAQLFVAFGFRGSAHSSHRYVHGGWQGSSSSHIPLGDQEKYYARKLGLELPVSPNAVRLAYRKLVKQYHPDKVAHLGDKLRETADVEMKQINEAYSYFARKHDL
jgi:uncharacterized membrane protein YhaH (DUF805 family)